MAGAVLAKFNFEGGTVEELARALEMCKAASKVPVTVAVAARGN